MYPLLFTLGALLSVALLPIFAPRLATHRMSSAMIGTLLAVVIIFSTSVYVVTPTQVGHLNRVYFGEPMEEGQVIAFPGQNGPQVEILGPGLHFRPFLRLLYTIEEFPMVSVPNGHYGLLTAKDGTPLGQGQFLAAGWPEEQVTDMLRAEYFIRNGGQKGTQLTVLRPGQYRLNRYLFDVTLQQALEVEAGFVAVIKSNVQEAVRCSDAATGQQEGQSTGSLSVPLVPHGCVGVWQEPLPPGRYYLNQMAYQATLIPTRTQSLVYGGGYVRRDIDLAVNEDGKIVELARQTVISTLPDADGAVVATVEGWRIPLEIQVVTQANAVQAPRLVAAVGDLATLKNILLTPALRSVVRDVVEAPGRKVLDLIEKRAELEAEVERIMQDYGQSVGIAVRAVRFGDPAIPPELLVVKQRQHIAQQLEDTYLKEQQAQRTRIDAEKAHAMAAQQPNLVRAELSVQIAELDKQVAQKRGEGEKLRLLELIEGQKQQAQVLGQEQTLQLAILKEVMAAAKETPEIVKVPTVLVQGESNGLNGPAAVMGAGNLLQWINELSTGKKPGKP